MRWKVTQGLPPTSIFHYSSIYLLHPFLSHTHRAQSLLIHTHTAQPPPSYTHTTRTPPNTQSRMGTCVCGVGAGWSSLAQFTPRFRPPRQRWLSTLLCVSDGGKVLSDGGEVLSVSTGWWGGQMGRWQPDKILGFWFPQSSAHAHKPRPHSLTSTFSHTHV